MVQIRWLYYIYYKTLLRIAIQKYKLGIAIVDHSIRPESKDEVLWLRNQVDALGLSFYTTTLDVPTLSKDLKLSEETVGRQGSLSMAK